jgi:nucleotide-binding universal stress UspA family protein
MSRSIVCGIDDTDHGLTVARVAARLSRALDLRVVLVHAAPLRLPLLAPVPAATPSSPAPGHLPPTEMHVPEEPSDESAYSLLERTAEVELLVGAELRPERGDPSERILAVAEQEDAELIVVGSRRRGSLATMLLGSVSHAVVNRAASPVVVVPDGVRVPAPWELESLSVR